MFLHSDSILQAVRCPGFTEIPLIAVPPTNTMDSQPTIQSPVIRGRHLCCLVQPILRIPPCTHSSQQLNYKQNPPRWNSPLNHRTGSYHHQRVCKSPSFVLICLGAKDNQNTLSLLSRLSALITSVLFIHLTSKGQLNYYLQIFCDSFFMSLSRLCLKTINTCVFCSP